MLSWRFINIFALLAACVMVYIILSSSTGAVPQHLSDLSARLDFISREVPEGDVLPLSPSVTRLYDQVWGENPSSFELTQLKAQCARTTFKSDVYLRCHPPFAGLTTIMSQVKVCIRLAVDTGTNLVIPTMARRSSQDLTEFNRYNADQHIPYGDWFDEGALVQRLQDACPNLKVARLNDEKLPDIPYTHTVDMDLGKAPYFNGIGNWAWPGRDWATWWNEEMAQAIMAGANEKGITEKGNVIVQTVAPLSFFNVMNDVSGRSLAMWNEMNYLLRYNPVQRRILHSLVDSLKGENGRLRPFYGIHSRTEKDSPDAWIKADVQITRILETADAAWTAYQHTSSVEKLIYLACGDMQRIAQFEKAANEKGWKVIDKYRLASSIDVELDASLNALPFDYQGMIDLGIMMISEFFIGLTNSAFSFSIAHARDPRGRYAGSTLQHFFDPDSKVARSHLFDDGEGAYPCCL